MPGIVGIISAREKDIENCLNRMITPMHRHDTYKVQKKSMPNAGFASIVLDDEHAITNQGSLFLGVSGEIVEQDKLRLKLSNQGDKEAHKYSLSELLLAHYINHGQKALCSLNGLYVIFIWDEKVKKLTIINDRYGICRLFYWKSNGRLMFASEYKAISWHPEFNKSVDELGLSDLLIAGHLMDDRTLFKNIKIIPMAQILTYHDDKLSFEQYWDYDFSPSASRRLEERDYIDQLAFLLREAVRKRVHPNTCILLTGGLDARVVAGMFSQCAPQMKVKTYTIGHLKCRDGKYAKQIAKKLGYDHTLIAVDATYLRKYSEECVLRTEGALSVVESWIFASDEYLSNNQIEYAMSGVAGNLLAGYWLIPEIMNARNHDDIKRYFLDSHNWNFKKASRVLNATFIDQAVRETLDSMWQSYQKINSDNISQKYDGFMCNQYERRHGSSADALGDYVKTLNPFFDNQLFDFTMGIPPQIRGCRTLYKKVQTKHLSKVARVPETHEGLPVGVSSWFEKHVTFRKAYHFPFRIKKIVTPTSNLWDNPKEYIYPNSWMRTNEKDYVLNLLDMKDYLEDYLNMDEVQKIINDHMNGIKRGAGIISRIVTFALWRKLFCD